MLVKSAKSNITSIITIVVILLMVYLFINTEVLFFNIMEPEGIYGFVLFSTVTTVSLIIFIGLVAWLLYIISALTGSSEKNGSLWIIILFGPVVIIVGALIYFGPELLMYKSVNDKYKYIEKVEKYIDEGKYDDALKYAEKVYQNALDDREKCSKFFFMLYLYQNTEKYKNNNNYKYLQAILSYADCLQLVGNNTETVESIFLESIEFCNVNFPDKKEYQMFPLAGLSRLYTGKGDNVLAEKYLSELLNLFTNIDKSNVNDLVMCLYMHSLFAEKNGEYERAKQLRKTALEIYKNSDVSKENYIYLDLAITVSLDYINEDSLQEASIILNNIEENVEESNSEIYISYLQIRSKLGDLKIIIPILP